MLLKIVQYLLLFGGIYFYLWILAKSGAKMVDMYEFTVFSLAQKSKGRTQQAIFPNKK